MRDIGDILSGKYRGMIPDEIVIRKVLIKFINDKFKEEGLNYSLDEKVISVSSNMIYLNVHPSVKKFLNEYYSDMEKLLEKYGICKTLR